MRFDSALLEQPPWSALTTTHSGFALGNGLARRYVPDIAPMAAVREVSEASLRALAAFMKPRDVVGLFNGNPVAACEDLVITANKTVEQMVYQGSGTAPATGEPVRLAVADVPEMMQLAELTKPGPFSARTILYYWDHMSASAARAAWWRWRASG